VAANGCAVDGTVGRPFMRRRSHRARSGSFADAKTRRLPGIGRVVTACLCSAWLAACGTSAPEKRQQALERILDTNNPIRPCRAGRCPDHDREIVDIDASTDGRWVALTYGDGRVALWDVGEERRALALPATQTQPTGGPAVPQVWLSPRGDRLVTITGEEIGIEPADVNVWSPPARSPRFRYRIPDELPLAVTPGGLSILIEPSSAAIPDPDRHEPARLALLAVGLRIASIDVRIPRDPDGALGARDAAYVPSLSAFVVTSVTARGYLRWRVGRSARLWDKGCSEPMTLSVGGSVFACVREGAPNQLLGEVAAWDVASGHQIDRWAPSPGTYGGGPRVENKIVSLALADRGRKLALSVTWRGRDGQHDRVLIVDTADHSILARHDLPIATPFQGVVGARLTPVGDLVVADQFTGQYGHRLFVFEAR
jgi:hypothetical protein